MILELISITITILVGFTLIYIYIYIYIYVYIYIYSSGHVIYECKLANLFEKIGKLYEINVIYKTFADR